MIPQSFRIFDTIISSFSLSWFIFCWNYSFTSIMSKHAYKCCIDGCLSKGRSSHKFPSPITNMVCFRKWVEIVGGDLKNMDPSLIYSKKRVCFDHFTMEDRSPGTNKLKCNAVPKLGNLKETMDCFNIKSEAQDCTDIKVEEHDRIEIKTEEQNFNYIKIEPEDYCNDTTAEEQNRIDMKVEENDCVDIKSELPYCFDMKVVEPNEKLSPPVGINPCGKPVSIAQKIRIINIYKSLKSEKNSMKYRELMKHISNSSGIGINTVRKTIGKYNITRTITQPNGKRNKPGIKKKIDDLVKCAIRKKVHSFWLNRELPTFSKVFTAINDDKTLPDFRKSSFRILLKSLDFECTMQQKHPFLIEKHDLVIWRRNYLRSIRRFREQGRPVYYVDETWIKADHRVDTGSSNARKRKNKRLIVLHFGSTEGFLPGGLGCFESKQNAKDCQNEINERTFEGWFKHVLPLLKENAVIVMDNASYNSRRTERIPTMSWTKGSIVEWLRSKGEEIDPNDMVKINLIDVVKRIKPKFDSYVVDEMAKAEGKIILRLPPYHCDLNPMEMVWSRVKHHVSRNTMVNDSNIKHLIDQAIETVKVEEWQSYFDRVKDEEEKFWQIDFISDEIIDELEMNQNPTLTVDDSTSTSEDGF